MQMRICYLRLLVLKVDQTEFTFIEQFRYIVSFRMEGWFWTADSLWLLMTQVYAL